MDIKVSYDKWTNGVKVMGSGADKEWVDPMDAYKRSTEYEATPKGWVPTKEKSDGATASYYELPDGATELQDLISDRNMNAQIGEIFRECYRYGRASHSDEVRGIKKILFYAKAELERLQRLNK